MKILLLCDKPPWPGDSGGALASQSMVRDIITAGYELDIIFLRTAKHNGTAGDIPPELAGKFRSYSVDHRAGNSIIGAFINLLFTKRPYNLERFYSENVVRMLEETLSGSEYDIIQFEGLPSVIYLKTIRARSSATIVMRSHNTEHEIWFGLAGETRNPFKREYYRILASRLEKAENKLLSKCDGLITITDSNLLKFREMGIQIPAITIYPSFMPGKDGYHPSSEKQPVIGYIGSLDWIPNLYGIEWFLAEVWPLVRDKVSGSRFKIAGRNPSASLLRIVQKSGAEYIGNPASSNDFMNSVSLLAVPLFSGSGIRIKIIESILNGLMVVTTSKGVEGMPDEIVSMIPATDDPIVMSGFIAERLEDSKRFSEERVMLRKKAGLAFSSTASVEKLTAFYNSLNNDN